MGVRNCRVADYDLDHQLVQIKYQQKISQYKNLHSARQRKYDVKKLNGTEIMRTCTEEIRKGIAEYR